MKKTLTDAFQRQRGSFFEETPLKFQSQITQTKIFYNVLSCFFVQAKIQSFKTGDIKKS